LETILESPNLIIMELQTSAQTSVPSASLFDLGNYVLASQSASSNDWQKFAAQGLIGKTQTAVSGLSRFNSAEARFYLGVTFWIAGEDELAIAALREASIPRAQRLLTLIEKPKINVMGQFAWPNTSSFIRDAKFRIKSIGFNDGDIANQPWADVRELNKLGDATFVPDFYGCHMIEWHDISPNIRDLNCPIFGTTADYDAHVQNITPWFPLFDHIVTACSSAWHDVQRMAWPPVPVSTFPKIYGIDGPLPNINTGERPNDLFISGFIWHPYNQDKTELLHQVLGMDDVQLKCLLGVGTSRDNFYANLNQAKATWSFVRRGDEVPTRALDSLALGCCVALQKDTALSLYLGEEHGLTFYDKPEDLPDALRKILLDYPEYKQRARRGAEIVRREWTKGRTISQFLRFLTFLASKFDVVPQKPMPPYLPQKDFLFLRGIRPPERHIQIRETILANLSQVEAKSAILPHRMLDTAREFAISYARSAHAPAVRLFSEHREPKKKHLKWALETYDACITRFRNALVPRFNKIRIALHFGSSSQVSQALREALEIVRANPNSWMVEGLEDVFPFDFFSMYFNYRDYLDLCFKQVSEKVSVKDDLVRLILASLYSYLGHYIDDLEIIRRAVDLDPGFAYYRLRLARRLVQRGQGNDLREASALLVPLAEKSALALEAFELLQYLNDCGIFVGPSYQPLVEKFKRYDRFVENVEDEDWNMIPLQPAGVLPR